MSHCLGLSVIKPPKGNIGKPIARIYVKRLMHGEDEKNFLTCNCLSLMEIEEVIGTLKKDLDEIKSEAENYSAEKTFVIFPLLIIPQTSSAFRDQG